MIRCTVHHRNGKLQRFEVRGHAGFEDVGQDIVCAAASVLVINAVNSCEVLLGIEPESRDDGKTLLCQVPQDESAQLLFHSMVYGLEALMKQYPKHVQVRTVEDKE